MQAAKPQVSRYEAERLGGTVTVGRHTPPCHPVTNPAGFRQTDVKSFLLGLRKGYGSEGPSRPAATKGQVTGLGAGLKHRVPNPMVTRYGRFDPRGVSRSDPHVVVTPPTKILTTVRPKPQVRGHFSGVTKCNPFEGVSKGAGQRAFGPSRNLAPQVFTPSAQGLYTSIGTNSGDEWWTGPPCKQPVVHLSRAVI